jgi:glycosyltransferase involved in cell wall biosynthesis
MSAQEISPAPLRVLQLNSLLTGGGTDDQCVKLAAELHRRGQKVWLAGPAGRAFQPVVDSSGVPFLDTGSSIGKLGFILRAARFIKSERFQIVHGHHGRDIWPVIFAARLAGTRPKLVLTRHLAKSPGSWASRRFLLGQYDAVIAVSKFVARVLREGVYEPDSPEAERRVRPPLQGNHDKIHVIHGGIDTDRFRPAEAADKRRELGLRPEDYAFAVVGGYDFPRGKGQREFLMAAARVHEKAPQARFLIIGRGSMAELLRADIARLGLTGKAWLTPYCSDMPQVMNAIDCLVHPQIGTEAFPLVTCEAQSCGKPVIASELDGIPETLVDPSFSTLVPPESIEALAQALANWAGRDRPNLTQRLALHQKVAAQLSLSAAMGRVLNLYQDLLRLSGRPVH